MANVPKPLNLEPIPGYRLGERLGSGGFGEVWKCQAPGGLLKALKFVHGSLNQAGNHLPVQQEWKALNRVKAIRHPYLLSMDRLEIIDDQLVIVMELVDKSLRDLLREYQAAGLPGIPREQLLGYLCEAAEVLDVMNFHYKLQHLDIKPDNLFLVSNHVKVGDFGLVNTLHRPDHGNLPADTETGITPLYAPPERFQGGISPASDQYSLAVVYQELLTGTLPFDGKSGRQLMVQHLCQEPQLQALASEDRPVVARALSKDPRQRFPSCTDFVSALFSWASTNIPVTGAGGPTRLAQAETVSGAAPSPPEPCRRPAPDALDDTAKCGSAGTDAILSQEATSSLLCGYRFLDWLGQSPLGELWKAQAPNGREQTVQFLGGWVEADCKDAKEALARLQSLRHPALPQLEVVYDGAGRTALASDATRQTLWDRFQEHRAKGVSGIPREELLDYLSAAAEALDDLYKKFRLHHLALNPCCLLLRQHRVQLRNFGLVQLLCAPTGQSLAPLNPRYSAPELSSPGFDQSCDVYSLALIYQELRTGVHPYRRKSLNRRTTTRGCNGPDLDALPATERAVITRALHPDPQQRFANCTALVEALEAAEKDNVAHVHTADSSALLPLPGGSLASQGSMLVPSLPQVMAEFLAAVVEQPLVYQEGDLRYLCHREGVLEHRCLAELLPAMARVKFEVFREQWNATPVHAEDPDSLLFHVVPSHGFWHRCLARAAGLKVHIRLARIPTVACTEVTVRIGPLPGSGKQGAELVRHLGPKLLMSIRSAVQPAPERRTQERLPCEYPLLVHPVLPDRILGEEIQAICRDVSWNGMRLWLPQEPSTAQVGVALPSTTQAAVVTVLASIQRVQACAKGGYDAGVRILEALSELRTLRVAREPGTSDAMTIH
jgi:serine/threonine protein kinase